MAGDSPPSPLNKMNPEEIQETTESRYLTSEEVLRILHEEDDPNRPLDEYDLSALYLQIGMDYLVPLDEKLELVSRELSKQIQRFVYLCKLIRRLDIELEQRQNQALNLERRIFALEEKSPKKYKPRYK